MKGRESDIGRFSYITIRVSPVTFPLVVKMIVLNFSREYPSFTETVKVGMLFGKKKLIFHINT